MFDYLSRLWTLDLRPWTSCLLTTSYELLRFIQPSLVSAILVSGCGFHGINTGLHCARGFALMTKAGVCATHQIKRFRIRWTTVEKLFERVARICELARFNISGSNLAPDFMLSVSAIACNHLFKVGHCIAQSFLLTRNASELVVGINLFVVNLDRALEAFARGIKFTATLMDQT